IVGRRLSGGRPVMGICVGMQILFGRGIEHGVDAEPATAAEPITPLREIPFPVVGVTYVPPISGGELPGMVQADEVQGKTSDVSEFRRAHIRR
ncbi:hypothetical protein ACWEWX_53825, partial [Streptomyces asiaticus]